MPKNLFLRCRDELLRTFHLGSLLNQSNLNQKSSTYGSSNDRHFEIQTNETSPRRPDIPILLIAAVIAWITAAYIFSECMSMDRDVIRLLCLASLILSLCLLICLVVACAKKPFILLLFVFIAALVSLSSAYILKSETVPSDLAHWQFTLTSDTSPSLYGSNCYAKAVCLDDPNIKELNVNVSFSEDTNLLNGQVIKANTQLALIAEDKLENYWNRATIYKCTINKFEDVPSGIFFNSVLSLRTTAIELFQNHASECAPILDALVCGYRVPLNQSGEYDQYKVCGVAHIVAVSGAHLAIVTMLLCWFLQKIRCPRRLSIALCCGFIFCFLIFVGIPISAIRAAIMVLLSMFSFFAKRKSRSLNALAICILGYIAFDPSISLSVSFFLSSGSTLGIILFTSLISTWFEKSKSTRKTPSSKTEKLRSFIVEPLSLTLSSNVVTLPFSAALFSQVSLIAPIANIVVTPLFSIGCVLGLLCVLITILFLPILNLAPPLIGIATLGVYPLKLSIELMSKLPFSCIAVSLPVIPMIALSFILVFLLWRTWPQLRLKQILSVAFSVSLLVGICLFVLPNHQADRICMLDVGQGDSMLVQSESSQILIDTGNKKSLLKDAIAHHGVYSLDAVFITHHDDDHCGSLSDLSNYTTFSNVYVSSELIGCPCKNCSSLREDVAALGLSLNGLSYGDKVKVGKFTLNVIWPKQFHDEGGNCDSLGFLVEFDADNDGYSDAKTFMCGDAESDEEEQMIASSDLGDIDVLKVGHHGSKISLNDEIANVLTPEIALISCGANNRYGHPSIEALDCLTKYGAAIYRTDISGCIDLTFSKDKIDVFTETA